jgi:Alpha/beta hydrolase
MASLAIVTGAAEAQAIYRRVCAVAEEYARALDRPLTLMTSQVWVGGGAPRFADELSARRRAIQSALGQAMESAATLVQRSGGPCLAPPPVSAPLGAHPADGPWVGVDVRLLAELSASVRLAGSNLESAAAALGGALAAGGLPGGPARVVGEAGGWALAQSQGLAQRVAQAERLGTSRLNAQLAGFGIFAAYLPGEAGLASLLDKTAAGDKAALAALLRRQAAAASPELAVAVNAWWQLLSPATQAHLTATGPAAVGALDGLPATIRDKVNRQVLTSEQQSLQTDLKALRAGEPAKTVLTPRGLAEPNPAWQQWNEQATAIQGKLTAISTLTSGLAQGGQNGFPPTYLLGFDTNGHGHAIMSFGNPDVAAHVVTYVPGTGASLAGASGDFVRAARLWQQASTSADGAQVASVFWLGYDAPQLGLSALDPAQSVTSPDLAVAGAPALDSFAAGLTAAHQGPPAHTVMLGHSYGSLVVGEAAKRWPGSLAQDLMFVGSPGVGVDNAGQLGVGAAHVWAGQAGGDPIPDLPPTLPLRQVESAPQLDAPVVVGQLGYGALRKLAGPYDQSHFGTNPAMPQFGGHDFTVAYGRYPLWTAKDHSSYWDVNSVSLLNMAHIVNGQYSAVRLVPPPQPVVAEPGPLRTPPPAPGVAIPNPAPEPAPTPGPGSKG